MPRSIPTELKAHYALGTTTIAQCWRAQLRDGTVIAATTHPSDLLVDGVLYRTAQGFNPSNVESSSDLSVDNMEVDGYLSSPAITLDDVHSGRWDYAHIILFEVNVSDLAHVNILRSGTLGQVKAGRSIFTAELRGLTQKYSRRIVTLTTQECQADLGDSRCTINLSEWTVLGTVASETNNKVITDPSRTEATGFFTGGLLTFTSGLNEGQSVEVKSYSPGTIELFEGMPFRITATDSVPQKQEPVVPDTYSMYAGCQKRFYQDCIGKFANGINFRGFPHLPGVGVFGGFGTVMTPASVPGSQAHSPPPPPAPGPAPGPAPAPGGAFPNKILACYFETYFDSDPFRITDVPLDFNVIFIFNGKFNGDGSVNFVSATTNAANIQVCRNRGQKCIFTVGGSDSKFVFSNRTQSTAFVNSIQSIIASLGGVDGVDFNNYEGSNQPAAEMIWIAQQLKSIYGSSFGITSPAGGNNGLSSLPDGQLIQALSNAGVLTFVNPQFYDWSGYKAAGWVKARVDEWVSLVGDASKVVIGLSANYDFANALTLAECIREYDASELAHPNIRGAFCWNARTNTVVGGNEWGSTMRTHVDNALATAPPPAPAPAPVPTPAPGVCGDPQGQIDAAASGAVLNMTGCSYSGTLVIDKPLTLTGLTVNSPSGSAAITVTASDVTLNSVTLRGPQGTTYASEDIGVHAIGTSSTPVMRLKILDSNISRYGNSGITTDFVNDCEIRRNTIEDIVYSGVMLLSPNGGLVESNTVRRIGVVGSGTNSGNAYGISCSSSNPSVNPRPVDVVVDGNLVEDVPTWHGLDTHAGVRITFTNNVVRGAYRGIFVTSNSAGQSNQDCVVSGNRIEAPAINDRWAIQIVGALGGTITNNNMIGWPQGTNVLQQDCSGLVISGNYSDAAPAPTPAPAPPPPATGGWGSYLSIPLVSPVPDAWLQTGPLPVAYWAEDDPWGSAGLTRGTFGGVDGSTYETAYGVKTSSYGPNGEVAARFAWKWPKGDLNNHEVKAYPSLLAGRKPGIYSGGSDPGGIPIKLPNGSYSGTSPSGATPGTFLALPANGRMTPVNCSFAWQHNITPSGQGHLTFDLWLQDRSAQTSGFGSPPITHEIMIPLDYWGGYGAHPSGRPSSWYSHDVTIQGVLWHVYMVRNFGSGWTFIVFEPNAPLGAAGRTLNLAEFLNYITTRTDSNGQRWASGSEYLSSVELGVEPSWGIGDLALTNFRVWQG